MQHFTHARNARFFRLARIPMRDGVETAASIYLPESDGPFPTLLVRTPYARHGWAGNWEDWTRNGYALVVQDVRGRFDSDGQFEPLVQEINDSPDSIAWVRRQAWCDGRVGMMGPSYVGWVQTLSVRGEPGSAPDAMMPTFLPGHGFERGFYNVGAFTLFLAYTWLCFDMGSRIGNNNLLGMFDVEKLSRHLPLETFDLACGAGVQPAWRELMAHNTYDAWWENRSIRATFDRFTMPTLGVAGWYDYYAAEALYNWNGMRARARSPEIANNHRLVIGPWGHHHALDPTPDGQRAIDFGPDSRYDSHRIYRAFFDRVFKGQPPADGLGARPLRIFVMGANIWRDEDEWPLARTQYREYHLHSHGHANTRGGDGALSLAGPGTQPPDRFRYDPENPMMARGGNHSVGPWNDAYKKLIWCGPTDQGPNEDRPDMLVYTTPPLESDLEVTGQVTLKLWASTSAPDTDFVAKLVDVHPDGKAINITEGMIRARFRAGSEKPPSLITPGAVIEYEINLQVTSNVFKKGHRIRLDLTSSNFPLWDRNLNTGEDGNRGTAMQVAEQTIWHDSARPSRLILPVIP